ncbi:MAG: hypothetical protein K0V04_12605 [Deltaproteobacteria bacterium]|nr:hypothetical protein [Deltaproteobacteria bacterium]
MMKTTTTVCVAVALAGLASASGCSMLVRAAKGELTPVGVTQASGSEIGSLSRTISSEDDPAQFTKAFTNLSSIYLYKCLENPTMAPKQGDSKIRERAGDSLLSAMHERIAGHDLQGDPVLQAASGDVAALQKQIETKCPGDKLNKLDPTGNFAQAAALAQPAGRDDYVQKTATSFDGELEQALGGDDANAVYQWASRSCADRLPVWDYCVPRAMEALYAKERWDSMVTVFLSRSDDHVAQLLPELGAKVGKDQLVSDVKAYMTRGSAPAASPAGLDRMVTFLRDNNAWGSCDDRKAMLQASIAGDSSQVAQWAIRRVVEDKCTNMEGVLIKALGSDSPWTRERAAWATGELDIKKAKRHLERLRWSDPYLDEGCWCHPVRDASSNAYNKLELAE